MLLSGYGSDLNPPCLSLHPGCCIAFSLLGKESGIRLPDVWLVVFLDGVGKAAVLGVFDELITLMLVVGPFSPFEVVAKLGFDVIAGGRFHGFQL
jgi:hypothetical protein